MTENYKLFECIDVRIIKIFQFFLLGKRKNDENHLFFEEKSFDPLDITSFFNYLILNSLIFLRAII